MFPIRNRKYWAAYLEAHPSNYIRVKGIKIASPLAMFLERLGLLGRFVYSIENFPLMKEGRYNGIYYDIKDAFLWKESQHHKRMDRHGVWSIVSWEFREGNISGRIGVESIKNRLEGCNLYNFYLSMKSEGDSSKPSPIPQVEWI